MISRWLWQAVLLMLVFLLEMGSGVSFGAGADLPVFPGAVGFGTTTPAGRGGVVLKVTNLNDSGPGSLREAINYPGKRIVVFEVSGRIRLKSPLTIRHPFCTIAGQTAPSPGITISNRSLEIVGHDVLIQHLAFRVGDEGKKKSKKWNNEDAIKIVGKKAFNIVIDHISASWSIDEVISTGYGAHDITISNSIISEPLNNSVHGKGKHGYCILAGEETYRLSMIGNYVAHGAGRLPRIQGGCFLFTGNIFYNKSGKEFGAIGSEHRPTYLCFTGNLFKIGPSDQSGNALVLLSSAHLKTKIFAEDNYYLSGLIFDQHGAFNPFVKDPPACLTALLTEMSDFKEKLDYNSIIKNVGSRPKERDFVDTRVIEDYIKGTGKVIDSQEEVGGFPIYVKNRRKLNIEDGATQNSDSYTSIENIIHEMSRKLQYLQ